MLLATLSWSCTNDEPPPAADPSPPASPETTEPETPETADPTDESATMETLVADLEDAGIDCTVLKPVEQESPAIEASARCDPDGDATRRIFIYVFVDATSREQLMEAFTQSELPLVVGSNWVVVVVGNPPTGEQRARQIRKALGGELQQVEN